MPLEFREWKGDSVVPCPPQWEGEGEGEGDSSCEDSCGGCPLETRDGEGEGVLLATCSGKEKETQQAYRDF